MGELLYYNKCLHMEEPFEGEKIKKEKKKRLI
jgi:hypothetical protein